MSVKKAKGETEGTAKKPAKKAAKKSAKKSAPVGLYPAAEQTVAPPVKDTLAHTLLTRLGLPLDPVVCDEDEGFVTEVLRSDADDKGTDKTVPSVAEKDEKGECGGQARITLVKSEHEDSNGVRDGEDAVE